MTNPEWHVFLNGKCCCGASPDTGELARLREAATELSGVARRATQGRRAAHALLDQGIRPSCRPHPAHRGGGMTTAEKQTCPACGHPHLPMPGPWTTRDGTRINPVCDWPMGPESCDCHRRSTGKGPSQIGSRALASQRSDGLGRSERAEERPAPGPSPDTGELARLRAARIEGANALFRELIGGDSGGFIPAERGIKDKDGKAEDWIAVGWVFACHEKVRAALTQHTEEKE